LEAIGIMVRKMLFLVLCSVIYAGLGLLAAILISNNYSYLLQDVLFIEGIILIIVGAAVSLKGNPSALSLHGLGQKTNFATYVNHEQAREESKSADYHKKFPGNSLVKLIFSNLTFIGSGLLLIVLCALM